MRKCPIHPKYKGIKPPQIECEDCLNIWLRTGGSIRKPIPRPSRPHDSKKRYRRQYEED